MSHHQCISSIITSPTIPSYLLQSNYLHIAFIILEYLLFIFPSTIFSSIKIKHFNTTKTQFSSLYPYYQTILPIYYYKHYLPYTFHMIFIILMLILFLIYIFIRLFHISLLKHSIAQIPQRIIIISIDLILFRYFAYLLMDYVSNSILSFIMIDSFNKNIYAVLVIITFSLYLVAVGDFLRLNSVILNITNPTLCNDKAMQYPYDSLSKQYDISVMLIKMMICFEENYYNKNEVDKVNIVVIALNAGVIVLNVVLMLHFSLGSFCLGFKASVLYGNIKMNLIRNYITVFNGLLSLTGVILLNDHSKLYYILMLIIFNINLACFVIYFEVNDVIKPYLKSQRLSYEMLLLLMLHSPSLSLSPSYTPTPSLIDIQNSCFNNHKHDYNKDKCPLHSLYSSDYNHNLSLFYNYLKKSIKISTGLNSITKSYKELVKLFHYKMTNQTFKLFRYYYNLIFKYDYKDQSYMTQLRLIMNHMIYSKNESQWDFLDTLISNNDLAVQLNRLLENMKSFFNESIKIQKPQTVVELSIALRAVLKEFTRLVKKNNVSVGSAGINEGDARIINSISMYNQKILQFILETLINQPVPDMPEFQLNMNEEYLTNHYQYDNILICSKDLLSTSTKEIYMLKITGELYRLNNKHYQYLSELFPSSIKHLGINQFDQELESIKARKSFKFPIISKGITYNISYAFGVTERLARNSFMSYGHYNKDKQTCALIDLNTFEILSFSSELLELTKLRKRWLVSLKEQNGKFFLERLFRKVKYDTNVNKFECVFDAKFFLSKSKENIDMLSMMMLTDCNSKEYKEKNELRLKIVKENSLNGINVTIEKIELMERIGLYHVNITSQVKKYSILNSLLGTNIKSQLNDQHDDSTMLLNYQSTTSISKGNSISASSQNHSSTNTRTNSLDRLMQNKINIEAKHLSFYSIIMIVLNIFLIITCIVFLIIQIEQSRKLSTLNDFFLKFKNIRICMVGDYLSLSASICISAKGADACNNGLMEYEQFFKTTYGLPTYFSFYDYLEQEIGLKTTRCLNTFTQFKEFLYDYKQKRFSDLLMKEMTYYSFKETNNQGERILFKGNKIGLEEGIKQFFNSYFYLSHIENSYLNVPIYFVNYNKGEYDFGNVPNQELNQIQMEIYKGLLNFINFYTAFNDAENEIRNEINILSAMTSAISVSLMLLIVILNLVLCFLSRQLIGKAYYLFKVLIFNLMKRLDDNKEFVKSLNIKLNAFIELNSLYKVNPLELIRKVEKCNAHKGFHITTPATAAVALLTVKEETIHTECTFNNNNNFYSFLFLRLIVTLTILFIFFFAVLITFDSIMYLQFYRTVDIFNYSALHYSMENSIYSINALTSFTMLSNMTDDAITEMINSTKINDGLINKMLREVATESQQVSSYTSLDPYTYPSVSAIVNDYSCKSIFNEVNDSYVFEISKTLGYDYNELSVLVCDTFKLLSLPSFEYLYNDIILRNQMIVNQGSSVEYKGLYSQLKSKSFYELSVFLLNISRPLFSFLRWSVLIPFISDNFKAYIALVSTILSVNVILETILFFVVKELVINRIVVVQKDLYLFDSCVH